MYDDSKEFLRDGNAYEEDTKKGKNDTKALADAVNGRPVLPDPNEIFEITSDDKLWLVKVGKFCFKLRCSPSPYTKFIHLFMFFYD